VPEVCLSGRPLLTTTRAVCQRRLKVDPIASLDVV
jgi:hypothetical protein